MLRALIMVSCSLAMAFCQRSMSDWRALRYIFLNAAVSGSMPLDFICLPTIGPSRVTIPRSSPVAASTITMSPILMFWEESLTYIPFRVFLKRTSKRSL